MYNNRQEFLTKVKEEEIFTSPHDVQHQQRTERSPHNASSGNEHFATLLTTNIYEFHYSILLMRLTIQYREESFIVYKEHREGAMRQNKLKLVQAK